MAIAFDARTTNTSSAARNNVTFEHTIAAGVDMGLLVFVFHADANARTASVTYDAVAMDAEASVSRGILGGSMRSQLFSMKAPPTGGNDVVVTWTGTVAASVVVAISYSGTDQDNLVDVADDNSGDSDTPSISITTNTDGSWIVGGYSLVGGDADPASEGGGVTERWDVTTGTDVNQDMGSAGGDRLQAVAGAGTINFTANASDDWVMVGVEVRVTPPDIVITVGEFGLTAVLGSVTVIVPGVIISVGEFGLIAALDSVTVLNPKIIGITPFALIADIGNVTVSVDGPIIIGVDPFALAAEIDTVAIVVVVEIEVAALPIWF